MPRFVGFFSSDPSETYVLSKVDKFTADYVMNAREDMRVYTDLADGAVFGTRDVVAANAGMQLEITLNAAAIDCLLYTSPSPRDS